MIPSISMLYEFCRAIRLKVKNGSLVNAQQNIVVDEIYFTFVHAVFKLLHTNDCVHGDSLILASCLHRVATHLEMGGGF